ncbi:asparagine synthetase B family protein [Brockia lithotrophica]|uniref:asparagine synthase (glutamine-hydrolyzing) n=1 Tax=Brockia lithotrophica TaxID=933949 RepID=A0A660L2T8_9BACL|nr:asparagine synthase-related protein [Brockia lithotrophica]RKQ85505.1 asparagine synthase (glutamine-hydrolysing) [Brockia lithotrophica]
MTSLERRDAVAAGVGEEGLSRPFWGVVGRKASRFPLNFASFVSGNRPPHREGGERYLLWFTGELENAGVLRKRANVEPLPASPSDEGGQERLFLSVWKTLGKEGLSLLSGSFAFALVDLEEGLVYLGGDPFGLQTLYYAPTPDGLFFATEILHILENSDIKRRANPDLLYVYLRWGLIPAPGETFFRGIYRVPPGFVYVARIDHPENGRLERFVSPSLEEPERLSFQEAKERVRELFFRALAEVGGKEERLGAFLSGGIDSSAIVLGLHHLFPRRDVYAVSFVADDELVGEERFIDLAARAGNVRTYKFRIHPDELVADVEDLVRVQEEPFGSTSVYAQFRGFRAARALGLPVLFSGQGADELLGGYLYLRGLRLASLWRGGRRVEALDFLLRNYRALTGGKNIFVYVLPQFLPFLIKKSSRESLWLNTDWFEERGASTVELSKKVVLRNYSKDHVRNENHLNLFAKSLPTLLRYESRNAGYFGIKKRNPFLNKEFADFIFRLPEEYLISRDGTTKWVFREAMRGIVPDEILDRRDKIGFATPEHRWLLDLAPWVSSLLEGIDEERFPFFRRKALLSEWERIRREKVLFDFRVWRWINVILWARTFDVIFE